MTIFLIFGEQHKVLVILVRNVHENVNSHTHTHIYKYERFKYPNYFFHLYISMHYFVSFKYL